MTAAPWIIANRTEENAIFSRILEGRSEKRLLLVRAKTGLGKSKLLSRFYRLAREKEVPCVYLDLKGTPTLERLVDTIITSGSSNVDLAKSPAVPIRPISTKVSLAKARIKQATRVTVTTVAPSQVYEGLKLGLLNDLRSTSKRVIIIVDCFEKAHTDCRDFVEVMLTACAGNKQVGIVVAGQEIPDPDHASWSDNAYYCEIKPIRDHEAWYEMTNLLEPKICDPAFKDLLKRICKVYKGSPLHIDFFIRQSISTWQEENEIP